MENDRLRDGLAGAIRRLDPESPFLRSFNATLQYRIHHGLDCFMSRGREVNALFRHGITAVPNCTRTPKHGLLPTDDALIAKLVAATQEVHDTHIERLAERLIKRRGDLPYADAEFDALLTDILIAGASKLDATE